MKKTLAILLVVVLALTMLPTAALAIYLPEGQQVRPIPGPYPFVREPEGENPSVTVRKVWEDDDPAARPETVQMQLYCNGRAYGEAVTVGADTNWTYTWFNLIPGMTWTADEVNVAPGYASRVTFDGNAYVITNTPAPLPPKTDGVPVGAAVGALCLLLAVCGAVVLKRKTAR